jgi:hypothetical protein
MKYILLCLVLLTACADQKTCEDQVETYKLSMAIWVGDHPLQPINFDAVDSLYAERLKQFN